MLAFCKSILVYIPGGPKAEVGAKTEMRKKAIEVAKVGVKVLLLLVRAFLTILSLSVKTELQQIFGLAI